MKVRGDESAVLEAGGLIDAAVDVGDADRVDTVGARAYRHPALGDRTVVRLSPTLLVRSVDVEMDVLGFSAAEERGVVGQQKRRAPGFPGWALIHDPDHASYALKVMDQFKREARRAKSKPGHAKSGIDAIGKELGRSVPHFLPSFYEEAGRAFLDTGNTNYAAQCFGKAREAERVHALDVDEEQRHESFLEFALAGAVTIKALTAYAKQLGASYEAETAYRRFAKLCVQRTLGGLPPWGGMAKELRRLGKAAELDVAAEERAVLAEIVESPALAKAAPDFWKAYRKAVLAISETSPAVRGTLLNLFPSPESGAEAFDEMWLGLLDEAGALAGLVDAKAAAGGAGPTGGLARWVSKWLAHLRRDWQGSYASQRTFELLRAAAPLLKESGEAVSLKGRWGRLDVDVVELLLELGIAVALPERGIVSLELDKWAELAERDGRGRDPQHLIADERFSRLVDDALDEVMGSEAFEKVARGLPAISGARRAWLERRIASTATCGLPALQDSLDRLRAATTSLTFTEFPELYESLRAIDCSAALATTLRAGIFDELGWDALDDVAQSLGGTAVEVYGAFPYACVVTSAKCVVVGPEGRMLEHDLRLPKGARLSSVRYCQGQVYVAYHTAEWDKLAYWSGDPDEVFAEPMETAIGLSGGYSVELDDGAMCEGNRALSAGDKRPASVRQICHDGDNIWALEYRDEWRFFELDPRSGKLGRASRPRFLEEYGDDGWRLDEKGSWLAALPSGVEDSPLGARDGLTGWRVRHRERGAMYLVNYEAESINGQCWKGAESAADSPPSAMLSFPGADEPGLVRLGRPAIGVAAWEVWDAADSTCVLREQRLYYRGTPAFPPIHWWHLLRPRDALGSRALRALDDQAAKELCATLVGEIAAASPKPLEHFPATEALLARLLPQVTNPRLVRGLMGVIEQAARTQRDHGRLVDKLDPAKAAVTAAVEHLEDEEFREAFGSVVSKIGYGDGSPTRQLREIATFFARAERRAGDRRDVAGSYVDWLLFLAYPHALLFMAAAPGATDQAKRVALDFLDAYETSWFAQREPTFRIYNGVKMGSRDYSRSSVAFEHEGSDYFIASRSYWSHEDWPVRVLEHSPSGEFKAPPLVNATGVPMGGRGLDGEQVAAFRSLLEQRGPLEWDEEQVAVLAERTGLIRAEAALLWAGLPNIDNWDHNYLPKPLREQLGLSVAEAAAARDTFKDLSAPARASLFQYAVPDVPAELWDQASTARRMADGWVQLFGKRPPIPTELVLAAGKELGMPLRPTNVLVATQAPDQAPIFENDGVWELNEKGELANRGEAPVFDKAALESAALLVPYLFTELAVGDSLRACLPALVERVRARLASEDLILPAGTAYFYEAEKELKGIVDAFEGSPLPWKCDGKDAGGILAAVDKYQIRWYFRPARMRAEDWQRIGGLLSAGDGESWHGFTTAAAAERMLSEGYTAIAARVASTAVPEGQFEANPLHAAPALVENVRATHDLSEPAACLYLQTLGLLAPTRKRVLRWNGWKAAQYKKAAGELVARGLVVEAKRSRAGRAHFLPGGWEALKAPNPPFETWKMPLYELERVAEGDAGLVAPLSRLLPIRPLHEIFAAAWARVEDGDAPAYEEVS